MQTALQEAQVAFNEGEVPIGAVIVVDNHIIASNHNRTEQQHNPLAHAEILVIRDACQHFHYERLAEASLYVTVEPCVMCAGALVLARIRQLVYGTRNPKAGAVQSLYSIVRDKRLNHQLEVSDGVLQQECSTLITTFFRQLRAGEVPKWS
ncbi:tRNA-specific adenosine deaminase [candidate division KSB3 bacterium]|uniref:tRNA-specific adenosine deaminase n=1 Tax=candidate division KSB3 bacterium TaxID=2044937 RepID=A0A2G6KDV8_9BACT|nr:MAG: tRNA-specific adenosine deaminase [candidate division KSB3 bacterium]